MEDLSERDTSGGQMKLVEGLEVTNIWQLYRRTEKV